jgi:hypothetical protein
MRLQVEPGNPLDPFEIDARHLCNYLLHFEDASGLMQWESRGLITERTTVTVRG